MRLPSASIGRRTGRRQTPVSMTLVLVSVLALVLAVAALAASCGGSSTTTAGTRGTTPGTTPGTATATTPSTATGGGAGETRVAMKNLAFDPASVTIRVGGTVTWTNEDSMNHNVVADNGEFESSMLAKGAAFSSTFATPGTYAYHCGIHPSMTGEVIVQ
jgi:plastocyanin